MGTEKLPDISRLNFSTVTYDDIPRLVRAFRQHPSSSCDYSVGGVMIWKDFFQYEIAEYDGAIFIKGTDPDNGTLLYYPASGNIDPEFAMTLIREDAEGKNAWIMDYSDDWLVENGMHEKRSSNVTTGVTKPDWDEYVYDINQFISFSGRKMEKKRNHLNYFNRTYPEATATPLAERDIEDLVRFTERQQCDHDDDPLFSFDIRHSIGLLHRMDQTPFIGIVLRLEGKVIGYSFGEIVGEMFFNHVEKGDMTYRGAYQAVASAMAREALKHGARYVNREDDMGDESLRQSKLSYHPVMMVRKRLYRI